MLEDKKFVKLYSGLVGKLVSIGYVVHICYSLTNEFKSIRCIFEIDDKGIQWTLFFSDVGSYIVRDKYD